MSRRVRCCSSTPRRAIGFPVAHERAVGGDSAGGNIAAVVAQAARDSGPPLAAQVLLYPFVGLDIEWDGRYPSLEENATGYYVTLDGLRWCTQNYAPAGADARDPRLSPALRPDLQGLPATVLAGAEYDPLRDQGIAYSESLRRASVPVSLHEGAGLIHSHFDMLGVCAAARSELERVLRSVSDLLSVHENAALRPAERPPGHGAQGRAS